MKHNWCKCIQLLPVLLVLLSCARTSHHENNLIDDPFTDAQTELREAIASIEKDIETANIEGLQSIHLNSEKFTKFGPRNFDRQDVEQTNESETAFFSSISNVNYEVKELKIDVFGSVGIATYYPYVTFEKDGEQKEVTGRQTLIFVKVKSGWKIVHEHGTRRN